MAVLKSKKFIRSKIKLNYKIKQYRNTANKEIMTVRYLKQLQRFVYIMINSVNLFDTLLILISYIFIYNLSLILLFWVILSSQLIDFKMTSSLRNFTGSTVYVLAATVALFSMAGVPPFAGFFLKVMLLTFLSNSSFFILFIFVFLLLFISLFFYMQNIRYLFIPSYLGNTHVLSKPYQVSPYTVTSVLLLSYFLLFSYLFLDDLFIIISLFLLI